MRRAEQTDPSICDVVISFAWMPSIGGAHLWLYEVYRRWSNPVHVLTKQSHAESPYQPTVDGAIHLYRAAHSIDNIDALSVRCWLRFVRNAVAALRLARRMPSNGELRLHCLRACPEGFVGLLSSWMLLGRPKLIIYAHGEDVTIARTSRLTLWMARTVYRHCTLVIANSLHSRRLVLELCPSARVTCIHPGVDAARPAPTPEGVSAFRRSLGIGDRSMIVCTVARMEARKNQHAVLRAVATLRADGLDIVYLCAGDGEQREALQALAVSLGGQQWALFPGVISDQEKSLLYASSDVFAMPSISIGESIEGFGIVFLEAAAAGLPSICGCTGGQAEAVLNGETGLVVDGADQTAVEAALRRLACDPELRKRMSANAKQWACSHDWRQVVAQTKAEFERIGA